eukprot:gnl/MRDRNA2_/MRDRNA2_118195_c0_seq1.p1 gnl/MRDRNA2_/MRDRNA2_118195_c0~~gnl/MRDRNA2_/MRDRNA2_118195_c0_seq1.p1  ORF type:complete len:341 (-),score=39.15 gnl/MRDRNA2_/MRDRNA2_118195_c0_seq1:55-957(-)
MVLASHCSALKLIHNNAPFTSKSGKSAQVFVINLADRKDRCHCMEMQMRSSPYPIFRQVAAEPKNLHQKCPNLSNRTKSGYDITQAELSIFCSHRLVFERVLADPQKPDFIILMEDDLHFKKETETQDPAAPKSQHNIEWYVNRTIPFWTHVETFLNSNCASSSWDMAAVDTNGRKRSPEPPQHVHLECETQHGGYKLYSNDEMRWNANMLIIKTQNLQKLLDRHVNVVDHFYRFRDDDNINIVFWHPGMIYQANKPFRVPNGCSASITESDVGKQGRTNEAFYTDKNFARTEQSWCDQE